MNSSMGFYVALIVAVICVCSAQEDFDQGPGAVGDIVFSWTFHTENSTSGWSNAAAGVTVEGGYLGQKALLIQNTASTRATKVISHDIHNVSLARNTTVRVSARLRTINVSSSSVSWDGVKVALKVGSFEGLSWMQPVFTYPQKTKVWGTLDWTTVENSVPLSGDISSLSLTLGLGNATGSVFFDSVNITITASVPAITSTELANLVLSGCGQYDTFPFSNCQLTSGVPAGKTLPNSWQVKIGTNGVPAECSVSYFPSMTNGFCQTVLPLFSGTYTVYARLSPASPWVATKTVINFARVYFDNYIGCFPDNVTNRDLNVQGPNVGNQMFDKCSDWCGARGYLYAGLQSSSECWCGNNYGRRGAKLSDNACDKPCTADPRYLCGGAAKNSVYRATDRTTYDYLGCYKDSTTARDLPYQVYPAEGVSVLSCRQACAGPYNPTTGIPQYQYAAVQNGVQCFCGNSYGSIDSAPQSECNKICVADPTDLCGGASRNAVWTSTYNTDPYDY